jgi:hypothetical protein
MRFANQFIEILAGRVGPALPIRYLCRQFNGLAGIFVGSHDNGRHI